MTKSGKVIERKHNEHHRDKTDAIVNAAKDIVGGA